MLADDGVAVAWLSLDERDNDPTSFWSYVVASLQLAVAELGAGARALLDAGDTPTEVVLATLVNELHDTQADVVLVLDDLHAVDRTEIHEGLTYLLDHLPHGHTS